MEKKVSIRDIAKLHVSQQLERKKAILLNLELDTCMRAGKEWIPIPGIFTWDYASEWYFYETILSAELFSGRKRICNARQAYTEAGHADRNGTDSGCGAGILWRWKRMAGIYQQF